MCTPPAEWLRGDACSTTLLAFYLRTQPRPPYVPSHGVSGLGAGFSFLSPALSPLPASLLSPFFAGFSASCFPGIADHN